MKILITIPDEKYHYIKELERGNTDYATTLMLYHAVKYGKPITRPQGEWIPVSERLPEASRWYLVYTKYDDVMTDFFMCGGFMKGDDIIAWQPLPEPYKAGGKEE